MSRLLANGRAVPQIVKDSRRQSMEVTGGLDADLKARENAKRDNSLEDDCCAFLTGLTGIEINDMMEDLKVGSICFLLFPFFITCSWFVFFILLVLTLFFFPANFYVQLIHILLTITLLNCNTHILGWYYSMCCHQCH